jgi:glycosyltransferase involved in cell wall biosynthesis
MRAFTGLDIDDIRVDVVIPVLNEAHVLEESVNTLRNFLQNRLEYRWNIVIVDNGSTDGTFQVAEGIANTYDEVDFLHFKEKGRGRALRQAWQHSTADVVLYTDVDLSTKLTALPKLVDALVCEGYDLAVGSRLAKESRTERSFKREVVSRIYNLFVKVVLLIKFSDAQCGFKAVTRKVVDQIVPQVKDQSWFFDTELLVLAEKQGFKIKDIPVTWIEDDDSRVKLISTAWADIKGVLRLRWLLLRSLFQKMDGTVKEKTTEHTIYKPTSNTPAE